MEAEVGVIKRAIKTTLVATKTEEKYTGHWWLGMLAGDDFFNSCSGLVGKPQSCWPLELQCLHCESLGRRCTTTGGQQESRAR